jgi:hypothetical protein
LGEFEDNFYSVLAFVLLKDEFIVDPADAREALRAATPKGRSHVAWYWWRQVDSATNYGATLFRERLKYLLTSVWPLEVEFEEEASSSNLARLISCCGTEFENAVRTVAPRLTKTATPTQLLFAFQRKDHPDLYPAATLDLLAAIVGNYEENWGARYLRELLDRILRADPTLSEDPRFLRLDSLARRFE